MSTYQGERFVGAQVSSILAQTHQTLRLVVRDDGSEDGTIAAVRAAAGEDVRVVVLEGRNLGLPEAFFHLIEMSGEDADLVALSDQDDVWQPGKIERAVAALEPHSGEPALYCSRVLVTDEALQPLYLHELPHRGPSFANALVQNIALGCTVVINRKARELLRGCWPTECVMHDAWLYLAVSGLGTVVYDPEPSVLYRQHARNVVGMGRGPVSRFEGRLRRQLSPGGAGRHGRQDAELRRRLAETLRPAARAQLEDFLAANRAPFRRLRYAAVGAAHRQTRGSDLVLKALLVAGRV